VEGLVTSLVTALYASAHLLITDVALKLPPVLGNLVNVHNWFQENIISQIDFRYPYGTEEVRPFGKVGLLECAIGVGAENASLTTQH
jgi:hypothetical protein